MSALRNCFSVHTVEEYLRLAEQCERAAERSPEQSQEYLERARIFRQLAAKRKPGFTRDGNFYK